jgi:hypothetical protein
LLEVTLAVLILGLAIVPMLGISVSTNQGIEVSLDEIRATNAATATLAVLRAAPSAAIEEAVGIGEVAVGDLPETLRQAVRLPPREDDLELLVEVTSPPPGSPPAEADLTEELRDQLAALRQLFVLRVRCRFQVVAAGTGTRDRRGREVVVGSVVRGEAGR